MPLAVIGAVAGVAGSVGSALISSSANNHAADVAAKAAAANNALSQEQYNTTKGLVQPYVDKGNQAADVLQGFLGLGGDPAKTQAAFDTYLNSTGYRFTRDQGLEAATQSKAANGLLNSGAALKSLDAYGTGLAQQFGQDYINNLGSVATRGTNAINALTGAGNTNVTNQSGNNDSAATAAGNAAVSNAGVINNAINSAVNAFGVARGASSFGGSSGASGSAGNAFNQPGYAPFYSGG